MARTVRVFALFASAFCSLAIPNGSLAAPLLDLGTLGGNESRALAVNDSNQVAGWAETGSGYHHAFLYSGGVMTDLGTLGGNESEAVAINASGQVVGWAETAPGVRHAFLYSGGVMTDLGTFGGNQSQALAVNDSGQVVGFAEAPFTQRHAFLYSGGVMTDLFPSDPSYWGYATAINASGQITGCYAADGNYCHAFLYSGGVATDLGTLGGDLQSVGSAINASGAVVGESTSNGGQRRAFAYKDGSMLDLGTFGPPYAGFSGDFGQAEAINSSGQIAGFAASFVADKYSTARAFLYTGGALTDLGTTFTNTTYSYAHCLNDAGQVAGHSDFLLTSIGTVNRAFLYSHGTMTTLGALGGQQSMALAINAGGSVVGWANTAAGYEHAFLRTAACGDGIVDLDEECDDSNLANGDCCSSDCTYPGPANTCLAAAKSSLRVQDSLDNNEDRFDWKWNGDGLVLQSDFGDPSSGTTYTLCVSDSTGGVDQLVASILIGPDDGWVNKDPHGWAFKDPYGKDNSVTKAQLKPGDAGKAKLGISARGVNIPMPVPFNTGAMFDQDARVTVQLFSNTTGKCWSSEFTSSKANTALKFQAKIP